jgi:hypothetical protein
VRINKSLITFTPTSGAGSGTVTSVAMTVPSGVFTVVGTPITTSGTFTVGLINQFANTVWAGPTSGAESVPTFRLLVSDDIPNLSASKITSGTLGVDRGGTGAVTLTGVLFGNGTGAFTGIASTTATQILRVNSAGTGYEWFTPDYLSNVMTSLGDMIYGNAVGLPVRRSGNITTTKMFLSQTGDGSVSAAPQWSAVTAADVNAVPYTGATGNVNLGEYGMTVGYLGFDLTPTATPTTQGTMFWSADDETVDVILDAAVTMKVGQDVFYYVKNQSGATIPKGSVVRAAGTLGSSGRILIEPFLADGTYPSKYVIGVTTESLANGADGFVTEFGKIRMINTSAFADGDILYASPTTAGGFTTTIPTSPNNIVTVAIVIKGGAANGTIFVRPTFGSNINEDEGVSITTPSNNQILTYNSTSGLWVNTTPTFVPTSRTITINDVAFDLSANREWSVGDFGTW